MSNILFQYKDKSYRMSGKGGTYKITTNFLARTQPSWYVAVQNHLRVTEVKNNECDSSTVIIFNHSSVDKEHLAEVMEKLLHYLK